MRSERTAQENFDNVCTSVDSISAYQNGEKLTGNLYRSLALSPVPEASTVFSPGSTSFYLEINSSARTLRSLLIFPGRGITLNVRTSTGAKTAARENTARGPSLTAAKFHPAVGNSRLGPNPAAAVHSVGRANLEWYSRGYSFFSSCFTSSSCFHGRRQMVSTTELRLQ